MMRCDTTSESLDRQDREHGAAQIVGDGDNSSAQKKQSKLNDKLLALVRPL